MRVCLCTQFNIYCLPNDITRVKHPLSFPIEKDVTRPVRGQHPLGRRKQQRHGHLGGGGRVVVEVVHGAVRQLLGHELDCGVVCMFVST